MDEIVGHAMIAARALFSEGHWNCLSQNERATAIYREIRRIDEERFQPKGGDTLSISPGIVRNGYWTQKVR
jgi:hypothetical protein